MVKVKNSEVSNSEIDVNLLKQELSDFVSVQVRKEVNEVLEKENKKIIREKNRSLFFKNVFIIILIVLIFYLVFLLFKSHYFDKYFNNIQKEDTTTIVDEEIKEEKKEETAKKELSLEELIKQYGHLIDNYKINEKCDYLKDYYNSKLTNELKNYISLYQIEDSKLTKETEYTIISNEELKNSYAKLFDSSYESSTFDFNGNSIKYISQLESYLSSKPLVIDQTNISREIINIELLDNKVIITTVEGLIQDDKLFNIVSKEEVSNYNKDKLSNYKNELNILKYIFINEKLTGLEV